jgi:hypothetical protein
MLRCMSTRQKTEKAKIKSTARLPHACDTLHTIYIIPPESNLPFLSDVDISSREV